MLMKQVQAEVDFDSIFAGGDDKPEQKKWWTFVKTIFVWLCEDTFTFRVKHLDEATYDITTPAIQKMKLPPQLSSNMKQMSFRPALETLRLGDIADVPIPAAELLATVYALEEQAKKVQLDTDRQL